MENAEDTHDVAWGFGEADPPVADAEAELVTRPLKPPDVAVPRLEEPCEGFQYAPGGGAVERP